MKINSLRSLLIYLFGLFITVYSFSFSTETRKVGRDIVDIPNPKTHPAECGRELVSTSSICDPDKLLSTEIKDEIEGYLNAMKDIQIAIVILQRMDLKGSVVEHVKSTSDIEKVAEYFARSLHNVWGVGDTETQKGLVLLLSIADRVIYISTGDGLSKEIDSHIIDGLIEGMRSYLRRGDYGIAIIHTLMEIDLLITRKIKSTYANSHHPYNSRLKAKTNQTEDSKETIFSIALLLLFVGIGLGARYWQTRKLTNYERGREQLDKIMKEVENLKENKFQVTSCPICLEDFPKRDSSISTSTATVSVTTTATTAATTTSSASNEERISELQQEETHSTSHSPFVFVEDVNEQEDTVSSAVPPIDKSPNEDASPSATASLSALHETVNGDSFIDHAKKPMSLKCGHIFCKTCLEEYLNKPDSNKCPICRADIDSDHHPSVTIPANERNPSPVRNRRSSNNNNFFGFRRNNQIHTLWNYDLNSNYDTTTGATATSSSANIAAGTGMNPGSGSYTQTQQSPPFNPYYIPELRYRLYRINHFYPDALSMEALRSMNSAIDRGSFDELRTHVMTRSSELSRMVNEIRAASRESARQSGMRGSYSSSWGGGSSRSGGGGRW